MKVAFHVDQLSAKVPGGIGTYIRHLVPALAELPDTELTLFHSRGEAAGLPDDWREDFPWWNSRRAPAPCIRDGRS